MGFGSHGDDRRAASPLAEFDGKSKSADTPSKGVLVAEGVHKHYGGVHALRGASLEARAGEVHGLVGENGSGKSTLLKVLSGQTLPDRASLSLDGEQLPLGDPVRALAAGIATVTQETTLVPHLSVAENVLLGRRSVRRWYGIDRRATRKRAIEALERLGLKLNPASPVSRLRPDEKQMVEIARAISMDARVLILDEPTSSLTDEEVEALFAATRKLSSQGVATIFVSHRLKEVFALTDRVTVLRDGQTVATEPTVKMDSNRLIELMVGHRPEQVPPAHRVESGREGCLRVRGLTVTGLVEDASLEVARGEIVGISGLVSAGRSELLKAIFGLYPWAAGDAELDGVPLVSRGPREAMRRGLAYVPDDRKELGLVLDMSSRENLVMAQTARSARILRPSRARESMRLREAVEQFRVRGAVNGGPVASLSGGNQQKIVLAKWLALRPKAILLDEPTRGVDVGAKEEIYELLERLRAEELAVLVSSSETPELLRLCDRILVMFRGRIVASLHREEADEARIAHYATGHD